MKTANTCLSDKAKSYSVNMQTSVYTFSLVAAVVVACVVNLAPVVYRYVVKDYSDMLTLSASVARLQNTVERLERQFKDVMGPQTIKHADKSAKPEACKYF